MTRKDHVGDVPNIDADLDIITFENELGETIDFVQLIAFELEGSEYAALTPAEELDKGEFELFVFHTGVENGSRFFTPIEDEDLAQRLFDVAVQLLGGAEEDA